ncbi:MAG: hypothetical protein C0467_21095 [Planctomycetaceae bacterium]|nr:hypothetical protein [Planctomycetaceae bacterium]
MAKTKTKTKTTPVKRVVEDDLEMPLPEALPLEPVAIRRVDTSMILDMEGLGGEVASALIVNGLLAYLSVQNKGVNLIAANRQHTAFVPVRTVGCVATMDIKQEDVKHLVAANGVVAFLLDDGDERVSWYLPAAEYVERAETRGEGGMRLDMDEHASWLDQYEGHPGIRKAFAGLRG